MKLINYLKVFVLSFGIVFIVSLVSLSIYHMIIGVWTIEFEEINNCIFVSVVFGIICLLMSFIKPYGAP